MITVPRMFHDMFDNDFSKSMQEFHQASFAKTDITESDNNYNIRIDVPGFEKVNFEIEMRENTINISGKRKLE